jgi:hypothetical protein
MVIMTRTITRFLALLGLIALTSSSGVCGQYSIDWFKISGGGGTSTGNVYTISGTIGQHDANVLMGGGNYSLTGGFWSLIAAVQTPGAPLLSVAFSTSNAVVISWPYPSPGFGLEQNAALGTANWIAVTATPVQLRTQWQVVLSPPIGNMFYRLHAH